ncbi:hypothetical protein SAMN04488508_10375 [Aquimarina spongiae]|uniref:Uncharacterized protein n=1 Tax=Aquimarina spongiae TaxID=570521 RepID=A0A1M6DXF9_9FLAO|nr:hypothetical protein SAMN04488508_10375 [Aquimarina spongiae]
MKSEVYILFYFSIGVKCWERMYIVTKGNYISQIQDIRTSIEPEK